MYYTTTMMQSSNSFYVLGIALAIVALVLFFMWHIFADNSIKIMYIFSIAGAILMCSIGLFYAPEQPSNIKVVATKVSAHSNFVRSGKHGTTLAGFVTYSTPDGDVSYRMGEGQVWPDQVILYKQIK